ncbi:ATP adenylyltransferase-domain-containing protein [Xylariomycetidae sp. FL2044]|nr:ATP adenylyltransferase-domain-containing protein [Xylariomycetidae sp. FL2044]
MEKVDVLTKFDSLVKSGAVKYDHEQYIIRHVDGKLKFQFIVTSALAKKPTLPVSREQAGQNGEAKQPTRAGSDISTEGYEITDVGHHHFLAANKFSYATPHLLLLTHDVHRRQYEPLDTSDFTSAWAVLQTMGTEYVAFYNCGREGGCSRMHKHMQLMPMPENSLAAFLDFEEGIEPHVPFQWFHRRLACERTTPDLLTEIYTDLLRQASGTAASRAKNAGATVPAAAAFPHNVLFTDRWMLVIPRRRADINKEAGANALGMLGVVAVATESEVDSWIRLGPVECLRELGVPR